MTAYATALDAEPEIPPYPLHVVYSVTNACNLHCAHCSAAAGRRSRGELGSSSATKLICELGELGVLDVALSGGEPLLRRDICELITAGSESGLRLGLATSGHGLTDARAAELLSSGLSRIQVSIDGDEVTHDRLRRCPGSYRTAVHAVRTSVGTGLRTNVCLTVSRTNRSQLEAACNMCVALGAARLNFSRFVATGRGGSDLDLTPMEWAHVATEIEHLTHRYSGSLEITTHLAQRVLLDPEVSRWPAFAGCQAGRGQAHVTPSGDVTPCVVLPIAIGNVKQTRFKDIWDHSSLVGAFKRRSVNGRCGECPVLRHCGGCRAVAFSSSGDPLGEDPRCWLNHTKEVGNDRQTEQAQESCGGVLRLCGRPQARR